MEKKENYTHEELVSLCEQSVVSCENWNNRDSLIAQKQLSDIYGYLTGNVKYIFKVDHKYETINIQFFPTNEDKKKYFLCLPTDSMEDFRSIEGNEDVEMFEGNGIDINDFIVSGYLPTKELLDRVNGEDWY